MTPKEKAGELIERFSKYSHVPFDQVTGLSKIKFNAMQCAILCVDELYGLVRKSTPEDDPYANLASLEYWDEVKEEILKHNN